MVVPLFVDIDGVPDFGWMDAATAAIAEGLQPGTLVSYETTLPIGTTRDRFRPVLESGGLVCGTGLLAGLLARAGADRAGLRRPAPLPQAGRRRGRARARPTASTSTSQVLDFDERPDLDRPNGVWDLGSAEAAELAKLAETTYRDVNIGLANQFALFAARAGIDIHQVIEASNSQPYSHIHRPGIAVGGHCIPVYPRLYLWKDPDATVVRAAREANAADARAHGRPARAAAGIRCGTTGCRPRCGVPRWGQGDGLLRRLRHGRRPGVARRRGAGARPALQRRRAGRARLRGRTTWASRWTRSSCRPTTRRTPSSGRSSCPGVKVVVDGRRITRPDGWGERDPRRARGARSLRLTAVP